MPKRDAIIFDCDEVLLGWISGFLEYHNEMYHTKVAGVSNYVFNRDLGISAGVFQKRIDTFNTNWKFGALKPIDTAIESIKLLTIEHPEIAKIIVTRCGISDGTQQLRLLNLFNTFGITFTNVIFLRPDESKYSSLAKLKRSYNILGFIDDCKDNIEVGEELKINSYLLRTQYNQFENTSKVVHSVKEFVDALINI